MLDCRVVMPTAPSLPKLTYEDALYFPEDGQRHELIDGEHQVTPAPAPKHQWIAARLTRFLDGFVSEQRLGRVLPAPLDVILSEADVVQPDLVFLATSSLERIGEKNVRGAPELVVEILSEATRRRDEITKRHLYERHGVEEYWIVDPVLETVKVYRRREGRFERAAELSVEAGDRLATPLLPGLEIDLAAVFE